MQSRARAAGLVWLLAVVYYFYQYGLRSAPGVMIPQLSEAFNLSAFGVASLVGLFYYGYAPFSLIAGTSIDRMGARAIVPTGALMAGVGAFLFATGNLTAANVGRLLQGAGGSFALVGAVYIASKNFPASRAATLIGAAQMFGMAGGSAGQVFVGPLIAGGLRWTTFWISMGMVGSVLAVALLFLLPKAQPKRGSDDWIKGSATALATVFRNPQSLLCGVIAGLLFIPTTIFDMVWGVRFLQEAHGFNYGEAVIRSSTVPLGWIIGCPLLGLISDRIGRRKPVIICGGCVLLACLAWILYGRADLLPPYVLGLVAGVASGAAMLTYTVCKEANPAQFSGTATGVVSFLNLSVSALAGPVFGWIIQRISAHKLTPIELYQISFQPLLYGVALAIILALVLKETGTAVRVEVARAEAA